MVMDASNSKNVDRNENATLICLSLAMFVMIVLLAALAILLGAMHSFLKSKGLCESHDTPFLGCAGIVSSAVVISFVGMLFLILNGLIVSFIFSRRRLAVIPLPFSWSLVAIPVQSSKLSNEVLSTTLDYPDAKKVVADGTSSSASPNRFKTRLSMIFRRDSLPIAE